MAPVIAFRRPHHTPTVRQGPTLGELFDLYLTEIVPTQAPTTQYQKGRLLARWRIALGDLPLADVTPTWLRQWKAQLLTHHSPGTARRYMDNLSAVLTFAVHDLDWLPDNPMRKVRKPAEHPSRGRFLVQEELQRLLPACQRSHSPALYPIVLLGVTTGARKGELLGLRWPDVDFEQRVIRLTRTKNGEKRAIPLPPITVEILRAWQQGRRFDVDWVFPRPDGRKPVDLDSAYLFACVRAGIENMRFHDLRHTAASYLAMSGASLLEIADILGHKTLNMTKRYSHLTLRHTAGVIERMTHQFIDGEVPRGD